jgi:intracellular septation protein A
MLLGQIIRSVRLVLSDLSGTLLFALLLALGFDVLIATVAGIAMALATVGWTIAQRKEVGALQWLSLALVIVSGAATLATSDPRYVMAKPSVIALIVGLFMLRPGWLARYIPADIQDYIPDVTLVFGFLWAGLMFVTAALNLLFVLRFPELWLAFLATFPALSKIGLLAVHMTTSVLVGRSRRSASDGQIIRTQPIEA